MSRDEKIWMVTAIPLLMGFLYLAVLKKLDAIDWDWWLVCSPLIAMGGILIVLTMFAHLRKLLGSGKKAQISNESESRDKFSDDSAKYQPSGLLKGSGVLTTILGFTIFTLPRWTPIEYPLWVTITALTVIFVTCTVAVSLELVHLPTRAEK